MALFSFINYHLKLSFQGALFLSASQISLKLRAGSALEYPQSTPKINTNYTTTKMLSSWLPSSPFSINTNNKCAHYVFFNRDFSVITSWPMFPFTAVSGLPLAKTSKGWLRHI